MKLWYETLGFVHNPFSIKPAIVKDTIIGQAEELEQISKFIKKGGQASIVGKYGVGKTTFLKSLITNFSGRKRVVYFSCNRLQGELDTNKLITGRYGTIGRVFNIKSKNLILLLDEAETLTAKDMDNVTKAVKQGYFKSVIYVITRKGMLPKQVKYEFHLKQISKKEAIELIRDRIGDLSLVSDTIIGKIYEMSKTPRIFLKNCEDVCRHAFEHNHKRVSVKDMKEAIGRYA